MKKLSLFLCAGAIATTAFAQTTLTNKNGTSMLPSKGSWGVGVSATPFINLLGNLTKINSGAAFSDPSSFSFTDGTSFFGKYFTEDNQAYRFRVNLSLGSQSQTNLTVKDGQADPTNTVEDKFTAKSTSIDLMVGKEFRKGSTRLQGFYGYQAMLGISGSSNKYSYGNDYSAANPAPTSKDWGSNINGANREISNKRGKTITLGVGGFAGVEYFLMPQMSIGGEFNYALGVGTTGKGSVESESWDGAAVQSTETETGGAFNMSSANFGGNLYFMLYF